MLSNEADAHAAGQLVTQQLQHMLVTQSVCLLYCLQHNHTMPDVVLDVEMACSGCSGAVERVLKKLEGEYLSTARCTQQPSGCLSVSTGIQIAGSVFTMQRRGNHPLIQQFMGSMCWSLQ